MERGITPPQLVQQSRFLEVAVVAEALMRVMAAVVEVVPGQV
jgi:hypothetical protein